MALRAAERRSLVDTVVAELRRQLAAGTWEVGERVPTEHALSEQLQVSRNTVREAVRVLVHAGMLRSRQGEGTFVVSRADPAEAMRAVRRAGIRDVLELRIALEAEGARLAALRHQPGDIARMRAALAARPTAVPADQPPAGRPPEIPHELHAEHDIEFHIAVVDAAHNAALSATYGWFSTSVRDALVAALSDGQLPPIDEADHRAVVDAIESRDAAAAEAAARALLEKPMRVVEALLAERGATGTRLEDAGTRPLPAGARPLTSGAGARNLPPDTEVSPRDADAGQGPADTGPGADTDPDTGADPGSGASAAQRPTRPAPAPGRSAARADRLPPGAP
ncbi:FadR family transcriptional regulator [Streptomyces sp. AJS327]|nr:FadR family transcriptional regulator [Streptomyces sp. AJS327]